MISRSLDLGHISDSFAIAPQLSLHDLEPLRAMGYRSVLIVRPDGEAPGQPNHMQLLDEAGKLGLAARYLPVSTQAIGPGDVEAFRRNVEAMPPPLVACSGSGRRAVTLWALSVAGAMPGMEILDAALRVGHDLSDLAPVLEV